MAAQIGSAAPGNGKRVKEDKALNRWRKLLTALVLVCLVVSAVPVVSATGTEEEGRRGLDYSELELQIGIANGLNAYDYTMESWEPLQKALEVGNKRLAGIYDQGKLDKAAEDIEDAISRLVKMDYSALNAALDAVNSEINKNPLLHDAWYRLDRAAEEAKLLLISGNQQAVNEAAQEINELLAELSQYNKITVEPEVVIQEVEVEVLPTDDFCNIPAHHTWPVLLAVSMVLNVLLVVALIYVIMKKQNTVDNTPLVSYDIDDDMDF